VFFSGPHSGVDPMMAKVIILCMVSVLSVLIIVLLDRYRLEGARNIVPVDALRSWRNPGPHNRRDFPTQRYSESEGLWNHPSFSVI
jgi:hypothetical protein